MEKKMVYTVVVDYHRENICPLIASYDDKKTALEVTQCLVGHVRVFSQEINNFDSLKLIHERRPNDDGTFFTFTLKE